MSSIIKPSYSFRNLPIYRIKSVGKPVNNSPTSHSLDFIRKEGGVSEAPVDGGKYVRTNKEWQNIADALIAISTLPQYLKIENEDKGTTAVGTHESTYDHTAFATTSALGDYLKKVDEDKGSSAVSTHETTYDHTKFITSLPPIPSDISDLTDTQDIIPPHLFFDDTYFSGAGTQNDPYNVAVDLGGYATEDYVDEKLKPLGLEIERENGIVSKVIYSDGNELTINRDVDGIITGWENDTHEWTLTKTGDTITGWTLTEKP